MDSLRCGPSDPMAEPGLRLCTGATKRARSSTKESRVKKRACVPMPTGPTGVSEDSRLGSSRLKPFGTGEVVSSEISLPAGIVDPFYWTTQQLLYTVEDDDLHAYVLGSGENGKKIRDDMTVRAFFKDASIDGQLLLTSVNDLALRYWAINNGSTRIALATIIVHLRQISPHYTQHSNDEWQLINYNPRQLIDNDLICGPPTFPLRLHDCVSAVLDDLIANTAVFSDPKYWYFEIGCISVTKSINAPFKFSHATGYPLPADAFILNSSQDLFHTHSLASSLDTDPVSSRMF